MSDPAALSLLCDAASQHDAFSWDAIRHWLRNHSDEDARLAAGQRGDYSTTALHLACRNCPPVDVISMLLAASPETAQMEDDFGWSPLHYACANEASYEVLVILAEQFPGSKTSVDKRGRTPLHFSMGHTDRPVDVATVSLLAGTGAALLPDENGMLPLHYACAYGATEEAISVLTNNHIETITATDYRGRTPFHFALGNAERPYSPGVVNQILSQNPAVVNSIDEEGNLPIHLLAIRAQALGFNTPNVTEKCTNCKDCLTLYLDANPQPTTDLLTAFQDLPEWLRDSVVVSQGIQRMFNKKLSQRFPTGVKFGMFGKKISASSLVGKDEIKLNFKKYSDQNLNELAKVLTNSEVLTTMSLDWNKFTLQNTAFTDALADNRTLTTLSLMSNDIGAEGAGKIADALKVNQTLQSIYLGGNRIGDGGAVKLADALRVNQTLQTLNLGWNKISVRGSRRLLDALKSNSTLIKMNVENSYIGIADKKEIEAVRAEIKSILSDPERKQKAATRADFCETEKNQYSGAQSKFYSKLTSMAETDLNVGNELQELIPLIANTHMLKFFYTATSALLRSGALKKDEASSLIMEALEKSTELCSGEYEIAYFKIILEKAKSDEYIDQHDLFRLDNRAEVKRIKNDPDILSLMEAVKSNTARIEGLEANLEAVNDSVNKIRKGLKHKMKVEAAVGFLSATINAISFGVGGNVIDATAKALGSIVDFGDIVHIQSVAADNGAICVEQVEAGIEIAVDRYADRKLEDALKRGCILTVVSATAVMSNPIANKPGKSEAESLKVSGDTAFREGQFLQAIDYYTKAISMKDSNPHLFSKRSAAYLKLGNPENALQDAITTIKLNQNYAKGYHRKGTALQKLRRFEEAETAFIDGLKVSPDNSALQKGLDRIRQDEGYKAELESRLEKEGNSSLEKGDFTEAVKSFSKAINLSGSSHRHFSNRSVAYLRMGDSKKALADALVVIKLSSETGTGYYLKGMALHSLNRFDEALSSFEEGIGKNPNDAKLHKGLRLVEKDIVKAKKKDPDGEHIVSFSKEEATDSDHLVLRDDNHLLDEKNTKNSIRIKTPPLSGTSEVGVVERLLLLWLPHLSQDDLSQYTSCLVKDGFDSVDTLATLERDDLEFMKKGHRRLLLQKISEGISHL